MVCMFSIGSDIAVKFAHLLLQTLGVDREAVGMVEL